MGKPNFYELKKVELNNKEEALSMVKYFQNQGDDFKKKKFAREYIVRKFFEKMDLPQLIKLIKIEQFK